MSVKHFQPTLKVYVKLSEWPVEFVLVCLSSSCVINDWSLLYKRQKLYWLYCKHQTHIIFYSDEHTFVGFICVKGLIVSRRKHKSSAIDSKFTTRFWEQEYFVTKWPLFHYDISGVSFWFFVFFIFKYCAFLSINQCWWYS